MKIKRLISAMLVLVMVLSVFSVAAYADSPVKASEHIADYDTETPVILVHGMSQNDTYMLDENGERIPDDNGYVTGWPLEIDIMALVKEALPELLLSIITRRDMGLTDAMRQGAYNALYVLHKDNKGNYLTEVEVPCYECPMSELDPKVKEAYYGFLPVQELGEIIGEDNLYYFGYDSFGDVIGETDKLHNYIHNVVLPQTGAEKVKICYISLGGTIAVNHFDTYPEDLDIIDKVVFIAPAIDGSNIIGDLLTNNLSVFYDDNVLYEELLVSLMGDTPVTYLLNMVLRILPDAVLKSALGGLAEGVADVGVRRTTIMWALCPTAYYPEAKAKWLSDPEYSVILEKVEHFMKARANFEKNLRTLQSKGAEVMNVCCYDVPLVALCKDYKKTNADKIIHAASPAMGTTFADLGTTLGEGYKAKGTYCSNPEHNHLSPDGVVDATTGLLPCTTWFFKGQAHEQLPNNDVVLKLAIRAMTDNNMHDVYSNSAEYPQFNEGRNIKNAKLYIAAWEEADKSSISADKKAAVEAAIAEIYSQLDETIVDSEKWLAAEKALKNALIDAGVMENDAPSKFEEIVNVIMKTANQKVNRLYEII
ncbi:MAG: hypothetical protein IJZ07_02680 [Clostridia bacterium]|nr:hypothetical protein [Clostridia bacterium]